MKSTACFIIFCICIQTCEHNKWSGPTASGPACDSAPGSVSAGCVARQLVDRIEEHVQTLTPAQRAHFIANTCRLSSIGLDARQVLSIDASLPCRDRSHAKKKKMTVCPAATELWTKACTNSI